MKWWLCLVFACLLAGTTSAACARSTDMPVSAAPEPKAGETRVRPADGAVMVFVPAGQFQMGSTEADRDAHDEEKPAHTVTLDAFWIDRNEVTNGQYRQCVEAGSCEEPSCWDNSDLNATDQPVVCVTWSDAQAYAAWVGGGCPRKQSGRRPRGAPMGGSIRGGTAYQTARVRTSKAAWGVRPV